MNHLLLKIIIAPSLVVLASLAGRQWGLKISGWIATFPIVAGPILFFFALEQGNAFAAQAAHETVMGLVSFCGFALTYAWTSRHWNGWICIPLSWSLFLMVSFLLSFLSIPLGWTWILAMGVLKLARLVMPIRTEPQAKKDITKISVFDLPFRICATAGLVLGLTMAARELGPNLSGVLTPFPVASTVLAGFAHYHEGNPGVVRLLTGALIGMNAFSVFGVVLSMTLVPLGIGFAFGVSLLACGIAQWIILRMSPLRTE